MKPSQAFGVIVRTFGLLALVASLAYALSVITVLFSPCCTANDRPWTHYLIAGLIWFLVGWFLLRRANRIVAFAYRLSDSDATDV